MIFSVSVFFMVSVPGVPVPMAESVSPEGEYTESCPVTGGTLKIPQKK